MALVLAVAAGLSAARVWAAEAEYPITIQDHRFSPDELKVPAGEKIKLLIKNEDPSAEEFESYDLKREKVVGAHGRITVFVGPLRPGVYKYFGEFHAKTAQGRIVAEAAPAKES